MKQKLCADCEERLNPPESSFKNREAGLVLVEENNTIYRGQFDEDLLMHPGDISTRSQVKKCPECKSHWKITEDYEVGFKGYWITLIEPEIESDHAKTT